MHAEQLQTRPDAGSQVVAQIRDLVNRWSVLAEGDARRLVGLLETSDVDLMQLPIDPGVLRAVYALAEGDTRPRYRLRRLASNLIAFANPADPAGPLTVR